jgi:hypothetical protein
MGRVISDNNRFLCKYGTMGSGGLKYVTKFEQKQINAYPALTLRSYCGYSDLDRRVYRNCSFHTGYIWLHSLTTKGATEVATAFMSIIRQVGPMKVLHTDNGKEFKNRILCKITEFTRIHHRFGSSYHPRAQGAAERENAEIE